MTCIITLHNNKVIQGKINVRVQRVAGKDQIVFDVLTRKNKYEINLLDCKKILFREDDNNKSKISNERLD